MNSTSFDSQDLRAKFNTCNNLGEVFKTIEDEFKNNGEVVCQFKVNGLILSESDEAQFSKFKLEEVSNLEVLSQKPADLLFGLLTNWIQELPLLISSADQLADQIRFQGIDGRLKSFVDLVDSCQFLVDSLLALSTVVKNPMVQSEEWKNMEEMTARAIGESLKAFEAKDFVLLAESLEYDLGHSLQSWFDLIVRLNQQLTEENSRDSKEFGEKIFKKD